MRTWSKCKRGALRKRGLLSIGLSLVALGLVSLAGCQVQEVHQPAANIRPGSLFREDLFTKGRFPGLGMSNQHLLPEKSPTSRHLLSARSQTLTISFGGCTFSCDYAGAPLVRTGSCPTQAGPLYLSSMGITSVQPEIFQNMTQMT
jgi:hypothetical protein